MPTAPSPVTTSPLTTTAPNHRHAARHHRPKEGTTPQHHRHATVAKRQTLAKPPAAAGATPAPADRPAASQPGRAIDPSALRPSGGGGVMMLLIAGIAATALLVAAPAGWRAWRTRRVWRAYGPY